MPTAVKFRDTARSGPIAGGHEARGVPPVTPGRVAFPQAPPIQHQDVGTPDPITGLIPGAGTGPAQTTPTPHWMDLTNPGSYEEAWAANSGHLLNPSAGDNAVAGAMAALENKTPTERLMAWGMPGILGQIKNNPFQDRVDRIDSMDPIEQDLTAYYEHAKRRGLEDINANAAARGAYGSSAALDQGTELVSSLEAERANREGEFALQRAAEMRQREALGLEGTGAMVDANQRWTDILTGLAGDSTEAGIKRLGMVGDLGLGLADSERARYRDYMEGAAGAQDRRERRIGDAFTRTSGLGAMGADLAYGAGTDAAGQLLAGIDARNQGSQGGAATGYAGRGTRRAQIGEDFGTGARLLGIGAPPTGGGGAGGGIPPWGSDPRLNYYSY